MSLEPEDVQEVLALLDSLDVDEMHLRTARFALTVRRGPGGWVASQQVQARPGGQAEDRDVLVPRLLLLTVIGKNDALSVRCCSP